MSDLTDTIALAIARSFWTMQGGGHADIEIVTPNSGDLQVAFDVLRTPEMQARERVYQEVMAESEEPETQQYVDGFGFSVEASIHNAIFDRLRALGRVEPQ